VTIIDNLLTSRRAASAQLLLAAALWGLTFTAGKVASARADPLNATLWRFILAGLILTPLAAKAAKGKVFSSISPKDWLYFFLSGLTGLVMYNFFFIKALAMIPASRGSVIVCGSPALIYLGSVLFFKEKMKLAALAGILLSFLGTAWTVSSGRLWTLFSDGLGRGDLIMLLCPASWTAYSLIGKLVLKRQSPLAANAWSVVAAVLLLLLLTPVFGGSLSQAADYDLKTWSSLAFLGLGGTALGFTFFYRGIIELGPHRAAAYINLVPVFGILCGWLILKERPDFSLLLGLGMILLGLRLVQKN
jgi:drug/metabolite transporter (DMT)-like permease